MSPLQTIVEQFLAQLGAPYFVRQFLVMLFLFIFGAILCDGFDTEEGKGIKKAVLAFPAGISAFAVTAYAMLVIGIPYNTWTVSAFILAEAAAAVFFGRRRFAKHIEKKNIVHMLIALLVFDAVAIISLSGLAPVSISNDSMYFFRRYPDMIVYYGKLRDQFDFWLTDTGLGSVSIDTLPALFGFGETFGIREAFHIDFIVFFGMCIYDRAKNMFSKRGAYIAAAICTLVLAMSTPFVILGHWALANMYFMELFFIAAYTVFDKAGSRLGVSAIFLVALALLRIEGTIFVVWLVLVLALFADLSKQLVYLVMIPMTLLFGGYCLRIFVGFYVLDNIYLFLTPQKAVMLTGVMIATVVYLLFVEGRLKNRIRRYLPHVYIAALVAGNIMLFAVNSELYTGNLKAFAANLFRQSGWGMFPHFCIGAIALIILEYIIGMIRKKEVSGKEDTASSFDMTLTVGFLLIVIAASYGRGDVLAENVGDSGNRVMLQIVPLAVMTLSHRFLTIAAKE